MSRRPNRGVSTIHMVAVAAAAAAVAAGVLWLTSKQPTPKTGEFCRGDGDCPDGFLCALGGCVPLLPGENPALWHDALLPLSDPKRGPFRPAPVFGQKIADAFTCPGKEDDSLTAKTAAMIQVRSRAAVYALDARNLRIVVQKDLYSTMWFDRVVFRLPVHTDGFGMPVWCTEDSVAALRIRPSKVETTIIAALSQSVPAHTRARATIMETRPVASGPDRRVRVAFPLHPVRGEEGASVSVLTVPLGSTIESLSGPPPSEQRLLTGHMAYYWTHGPRRASVAATVRLPSTPRFGPVDLKEIKPRL